MWAKLQKFHNAHERQIVRFNDIVMTLMTASQAGLALRSGNIEALKLQGVFAVLWIVLIYAQAYIYDQRMKAKKHSQDIDADRLTRLSLPEVYEDYLRRKQQAQALYEAEMDTLEKDYKQYLNALEEEAQEHDA